MSTTRNISAFAFIVTLGLITLCCSSTKTESWTSYDINEIGVIKTPPTLELRDQDSFAQRLSDKTRQFRSKAYKIVMVPPTLLFQPAGINQNNVDTYSRILLYIDKGKPGDFMRYNEIRQLSSKDNDEFYNFLIHQIRIEAKQTGIKIITIKPYEILEISGISAFKFSYIRQLESQSPVHVNVYMLFNNDVKIEITMSYRVNEEHLWAKDFEQIIENIQLIKR